ncbi:MAG: Tad domain-containing protein [Pseudomonadales bacterium]|nr:Tad domain-containing protein [Pseudomonadales bacterium]
MKMRRYQQGQALIFVVGFTAILILAVAYVFNSGQISNEKSRLQNTADAVAYSVAVVEAKDLNFKAYTNRAMVANQVAIAQAVGVVSWSRWLQNTSRNLATVTSWIPYVNAVTRVVQQVATAINRVAEPLMQGIAIAADTVNRILSGSQTVMHGATVLIARETLVDIARENDPDVDVGMSVRNALFFGSMVRNHNRYTRRYNPNSVRNRRGRDWREHRERMDEFRTVTMDSRDRFSVGRNYRLGPRVTIWPIRLEIRRRGGTQLVSRSRGAPYYTWAAMDTMSLHRSRFRCRRWRCRWRGWSETLPIGWGAAQASQRREVIDYRSFRGSRDFGGSWRTNRRASYLARSEFSSARNVNNNHYGLLPFYDIRSDGLVEEGPGLLVYLSKRNSNNAIRTVRNTGFNRRNTDIDIEERGGMVRGRMGAMSKAVPYFSRPNDVTSLRRRDRFQEYGNLYNPYWQAKLDSITSSEKRRVQVISRTL